MDFGSYFQRTRFGGSLFQVGIGGFSLYATVRQGVTLKATAPNAVVEDGSILNDHIINDPEAVIIEGVVGDVYQRNSAITNRVTPLSNTLGQITSYIPRFTAFQNQIVSTLQNTASIAIGNINSILAAGNPLNAIVGNLDKGSKTLQDQFRDAIENVYYGKQIIPIDIDGRRYDNMVILLAQFDRDNVTSALSFRIEAQRFRLAKTKFVEVGKVARADKNPSSALQGQTADVKQVGSQTGQKREVSFLAKYAKKLGG